jgi:hypothetical protein
LGCLRTEFDAFPVWKQRQLCSTAGLLSSTVQAKTLIDLGADVWPMICVHDFDAYLALPQVSRAIREAFEAPMVRAKCLEGIAAAHAKEAVPAGFADALTAQRFEMRLRGYVRRLAIDAIRKHDMSVLRQSVDSLGLSVASHGDELLHRAMQYDSADAVEWLLQQPDLVLPPHGSPQEMIAELGWDLNVIRPDLQGKVVLQMDELPRSFNPVFVGVCYHVRTRLEPVTDCTFDTIPSHISPDPTGPT